MAVFFSRDARARLYLPRAMCRRRNFWDRFGKGGHVQRQQPPPSDRETPRVIFVLVGRTIHSPRASHEGFVRNHSAPNDVVDCASRYFNIFLRSTASQFLPAGRSRVKVRRSVVRAIVCCLSQQFPITIALSGRRRGRNGRVFRKYCATGRAIAM